MSTAAPTPPSTPPAPRARWALPGPVFRPRLPAGGGGERRVRVPTVLQMEAVECGAASLAMVLAYHGRHVPLEELRVACGISRDGSKASNLLKAARQYGLEAKGYRREPAGLRDVPLPAILHWNFNHFVVLEGFRNGKAFINDPAHGPVALGTEEFDQAFTGVVLTFQKDAAFRPGGRPPGLLAALVPRLAGAWEGVAYVFLAGLFLVLPGLAVPTYGRVFVDNVLVRGLHDWLRPLLILMAVTGIVQIVLTWLQQRHLLRLETRLALTTSARFFWHVLRLPLHFFTQRYAGEIANRVSINDRVARLLSGDLATTLLGMVMIAFYAALMVQYDVFLTAVSVGVVAVNLAALKWMSRARTDLSQRLLQDRGKVMGVAMNGLQTIETLKATGSESDFFGRWAGYHAKAVNAGQQLALTTQLLGVLPPFLLSVNTALVLGIGGSLVMDGELSMGMLMAFHALMLAFVAPVNRMVTLGGTLQEVKGDMTRLDDVLRAEPDAFGPPEHGDPAPPADAEPSDPSTIRGESARSVAAAARLTGHVELRDVTFGYSPLDPPLISGFSLTLKPGSRVALVGGSGCGKSTVARLLTGLHQPWSGEILFDGVPRDRVPRDVMTASLAMVDQDVFLFEGTVRDNLALWDPTIPEADLVQAARDARIHDEVAQRYGGYASGVEEGGRNFSGGQRQRLEIARALAGSPSILVLDEATSALDPATEKEIDDHLRRRGCTCLLVAHRLSTIRDCDEIIVLDRGKIVQRGTHEELVAQPGLYARLIASE